jgi:hypothetical protein|tara:strand:+ start:770 stop:1033 length:264 start_codon:yes stop_codon:yes gene_type:complete
MDPLEKVVLNPTLPNLHSVSRKRCDEDDQSDRLAPQRDSQRTEATSKGFEKVNTSALLSKEFINLLLIPKTVAHLGRVELLSTLLFL